MHFFLVCLVCFVVHERGRGREGESVSILKKGAGETKRQKNGEKGAEEERRGKE